MKHDGKPEIMWTHSAFCNPECTSVPAVSPLPNDRRYVGGNKPQCFPHHLRRKLPARLEDPGTHSKLKRWGVTYFGGASPLDPVQLCVLQLAQTFSSGVGISVQGFWRRIKHAVFICRGWVPHTEGSVWQLFFEGWDEDFFILVEARSEAAASTMTNAV